MTARADRLAELARLAALVADRAQGPVVQAHERLAQGRALIEDMAAHRAGLNPDGADPVLAARLAHQVERLRLRQAMAMADLARAQAELDLAKAAARPAMARKLVLERLLKGATGKG